MSTTPAEPTLTEPTVTPTTEPTANGEPTRLPDDHPLVTALATLKNEVRTLKAERIDPAELQRLREVDAASKTQAEKDAEELARLREENTGYKTRDQIAAWAKEVSEETEVPADLLRGSTKEELQAHAEQLKKLIAAQAPPAPGAVPTIGNVPTVPNITLADQIAEAEKAGNHRLAIALKRQLAAESKK